MIPKSVCPLWHADIPPALCRKARPSAATYTTSRDTTAAAWGGNPDKDATYLNRTPAKNDGTTIYRLDVRDVPVDGFWSISLYNSKGYYEKNPYDAYSLNNVTAQKSEDGSISIQVGGCDSKIPNCLPIMNGWNYTVRLYRPGEAILNGTWKFPEPKPVN